MKTKIEELRAIYPQGILESDKDYVERCFKTMLHGIIASLEAVKRFEDINVTRSWNDKIVRYVIEVKVK
jgi:hypothetical protein